MDNFTRFKRQILQYLLAAMLVVNSMLIGSWFILNNVLGLGVGLMVLVLVVEAVILSWVIASLTLKYVTEPVKFLWQAIVHVSPGGSGTAAPNLNNSKVGKELITNLCLQIYQLASTVDKSTLPGTTAEVRAKTIAANLPLPLIVLDKQRLIVFANDAAHKYLGFANNELVGQNLYSKLDLTFPTNDTLDSWFANVSSNTVTSTRTWEHVRLNRANSARPLQFDMAVSFNRDNTSGAETIMTLFDRSKTYGTQDGTIDLLVMAVHELRTPLTLMRGYVEVFEEDLAGKLTPELAGYLEKMQASTQQLVSIINNILAVASIESNQLTLHLQEENWNEFVASVIHDMSLRASTKDIKIEARLADNLPTVAADRNGAYEVLVNLIENAIKYSGQSSAHKIIVKTELAEDNLVQTTVEDFGLGIATNIVPHLFERFYRNFHTQNQVSGTGLGLYLCKTIVNAHGGNIWVRSKEGDGTSIGFTLKPYSQLADELKNSDNKDIVRSAHGWIKNHSLYRR